MIKRTLLSLLLTALSCGLQAASVEVDFLGKLDDAQENVADPEKARIGKYTIIEMMAKCEFDEQCELNMKPQLEKLAKEDKNIIYSAFLKYLNWEKSDLEFNIKHCQIDDKKALRKVYAKCYLEWVDAEKNHSSQNRHDIDVLEDKRYRCLQENALPLAEAGNIFAQADLVNLAQHFQETAQMNKWAAKIEALKNTHKYEQYMKCSEIP